MESLLSLVVGVLFATGTYLILRRNLLKIVIGLSLIANAVNLLIFTATGLVRDHPPIIAGDAVRLDAPYADPLSQAMILTAIVITFGFLAFFIVLVLRISDVIGSDDPDEANTTEEAALDASDATGAGVTPAAADGPQASRPPAPEDTGRTDDREVQA